MSKFRAFLADESGDSIAEALVAFAIAALAVAVFAGAVASSTSVTTRAQKALEEAYATSSALAQRAAPDATGTLSLRLKDYDGEGTSHDLSGVTVDVYRAGSGDGAVERFDGGEAAP